MAGQNINDQVRSRLLRLLRENEATAAAFTQGSADYLATRARDRILRGAGKKSVEPGIDAAGATLGEVVAKLTSGQAAPAAPATGRFELRRLRRLVEGEAVCGVFPWC